VHKVLSPVPCVKFGGARTLHAARVAKLLRFYLLLCVCESHSFEQQSLGTRLRPEGVEI